MSKIKSYEDSVGWPSRSLKMTLQMIFWAKLDFQISNPAVTPSEGPFLEASIALHRYKQTIWLENENFKQKKTSKPTRSPKWHSVICFYVFSKQISKIFRPGVISSKRLPLEDSKALLRRKYFDGIEGKSQKGQGLDWVILQEPTVHCENEILCVFFELKWKHRTFDLGKIFIKTFWKRILKA